MSLRFKLPLFTAIFVALAAIAVLSISIYQINEKKKKDIQTVHTLSERPGSAKELLAFRIREIEGDTDAIIRDRMIFFFIIIVVCTLVIFVFSKRITGPINQLVSLSEEIILGHKDYSERILIRSHDEIGRLSKSFNTLLGHTELSLKKARENAEKYKEVLSLIAARSYGAVVLDILMLGIAGTALLSEILQLSPQTSVIMLTAVNDVDTAMACMRQGAFDYLVKPVEKDRLVTTVRRALDMVALSNENRILKSRLLDSRLETPECFEHIVTRNRRMTAIFQYIEAVAQSNLPVLIQGETGTGKELVARAIHLAGKKAGEFVCVNAAGLNDALFSDALFGHHRGAFTGADGRREGLVAKAAKGTLFLDEIGDLPLESQVKLLRLLEEHTYYPVGSDTRKTTDARFVVATNHDLALRKKEGAFRSDLYYRLEAHRKVE